MELSQAAGLPPLGEGRAGGDELRLWSFSFRATRNFVIVLRDEPNGVRGEIVFWWSSHYAPDPRWVPPGWRCARHVVKPAFRLCRAAFAREPDWSRLLRDLERENLLVNGTDLVVEVHRAGRARAYAYAIPKYLSGPHARKAERILDLAWEFFDSLGNSAPGSR